MTVVVLGLRWSPHFRRQAVNLFCLRRSFSDGSWPFEQRWATRRQSGNEHLDLIRRGLAAAVAERREDIGRDQLLHQFLTVHGILDRGLDTSARNAEEPDEYFPVVRHEQIELAPEVTRQRGAPAAGRDGEEQITATYDGGDNKVGLTRVVHDANQDAGVARVSTHLSIHLAVIGGRHDERHIGKVPGRVPPLDERQRVGLDEPRKGRRETRTHNHDVSPNLEEASRLAGPDFAAADHEDATITET